MADVEDDVKPGTAPRATTWRDEDEKKSQDTIAKTNMSASTGYMELRSEEVPRDGRGREKEDGAEVELRRSPSTVLGGPSTEAPSDERRNNGDAVGEVHEYKVYKRRWFGLVQLTLLNIIVSWDVSSLDSPP